MGITKDDIYRVANWAIAALGPEWNDQVEDIRQEIALRLLEVWDQVQGADDPEAYAKTVATNRLIDYERMIIIRRRWERPFADYPLGAGGIPRGVRGYIV